MSIKGIDIGSTYAVKVGAKCAPVRILRDHEEGGWVGLNESSGKEVRITVSSVERRFRGLIRRGEEG